MKRKQMEEVDPDYMRKNKLLYPELTTEFAPKKYKVLSDLSHKNQKRVLNGFEKLVNSMGVTLGSCPVIRKRFQLISEAVFHGKFPTLYLPHLANLVAEFLFPINANYIVRDGTINIEWSSPLTFITYDWCSPSDNYSDAINCSCKRLRYYTDRGCKDMRRPCSVVTLLFDDSVTPEQSKKWLLPFLSHDKMTVTEDGREITCIFKFIRYHFFKFPDEDLLWRFGGLHTRAGFPVPLSNKYF